MQVNPLPHASRLSCPAAILPRLQAALAAVLTSSLAGGMSAYAQVPGDAAAVPGAVVAQVERPAHQGGAHMRHGAAHDPIQRLSRRLDSVQVDLHLKPEQLPAWDAFRAKLTAQAQARLGQFRERSALDRSPDEVMRERAALLRDHALALEETAKLLKALVDQLSPEQRTILRLHRQASHRMMHPMQMRHPMHGFGSGAAGDLLANLPGA